MSDKRNDFQLGIFGGATLGFFSGLLMIGYFAAISENGSSFWIALSAMGTFSAACVALFTAWHGQRTARIMQKGEWDHLAEIKRHQMKAAVWATYTEMDRSNKRCFGFINDLIVWMRDGPDQPFDHIRELIEPDNQIRMLFQVFRNQPVREVRSLDRYAEALSHIEPHYADTLIHLYAEKMTYFELSVQSLIARADLEGQVSTNLVLRAAFALLQAMAATELLIRCVMGAGYASSAENTVPLATTLLGENWNHPITLPPLNRILTDHELSLAYELAAAEIRKLTGQPADHENSSATG